MGEAAGAFDLAIRNGTVVTASARYQADLGIVEGRIAQVGGQYRGPPDDAPGSE